MVMNITLKDTTGNKANGFRLLNEDSVLALITSVTIDKGNKTYKHPIIILNLNLSWKEN